jgi:hypothetical protein
MKRFAGDALRVAAISRENQGTVCRDYDRGRRRQAVDQRSRARGGAAFVPRPAVST